MTFRPLDTTFSCCSGIIIETFPPFISNISHEVGQTITIDAAKYSSQRLTLLLPGGACSVAQFPCLAWHDLVINTLLVMMMLVSSQGRVAGSKRKKALESQENGQKKHQGVI